MPEGILVQLTHTGLSSGSIFLSDVDNAVSDLDSFRKAGPVYVPVGGTVTLVYTTSVSKSYEAGSIRQFKNAGYLTTAFLFGTEFVSALLAYGGVPKLAALPGNNEGYGTGYIVVWTIDPIQGPRTYQNIGTDAAVDWKPFTKVWDVAGNPNVLAEDGYFGDRVRDTVGGVNYQQRTIPSGTTWDVI